MPLRRARHGRHLDRLSIGATRCGVRDRVSDVTAPTDGLPGAARKPLDTSKARSRMTCDMALRPRFNDDSVFRSPDGRTIARLDAVVNGPGATRLANMTIAQAPSNTDSSTGSYPGTDSLHNMASVAPKDVTSRGQLSPALTLPILSDFATLSRVMHCRSTSVAHRGVTAWVRNHYVRPDPKSPLGESSPGLLGGGAGTSAAPVSSIALKDGSRASSHVYPFVRRTFAHLVHHSPKTYRAPS